MKRLLHILLVVGLATDLFAGYGKGTSNSSSSSSKTTTSTTTSKASPWKSPAPAPTTPKYSSGSSNSGSKPVTKNTYSTGTTNTKPAATTTPTKVTTSKPPSAVITKAQVEKAKQDVFAASKAKEAETRKTPIPQTEYVSRFKQENAQKYVNHFPTEPPVKPAYIPPVYVDNTTSRSYNIIYDHGYGGYGYRNTYGIFMPYDPLEHVALDSYNSYHTLTQPQHVVVSHRSSGWSYLGWFFLGFIIMVIVTTLILNYR